VTPGVDPSSTAYRVHAYAFNTLTQMMAGDEWSVPLSERDAIASAIVEVIEPLIRADEREHAAHGETRLDDELAEAGRVADDYREALTRAEQALDQEREQVRLAREDRDQLRKQVLDLAADLDGRCATRPPGRSHTEHEIAIALRKIAEPPS
jgi:hypothetical protein